MKLSNQVERPCGFRANDPDVEKHGRLERQHHNAPVFVVVGADRIDDGNARLCRDKGEGRLGLAPPRSASAGRYLGLVEHPSMMRREWSCGPSETKSSPARSVAWMTRRFARRWEAGKTHSARSRCRCELSTSGRSPGKEAEADIDVLGRDRIDQAARPHALDPEVTVGAGLAERPNDLGDHFAGDGGERREAERAPALLAQGGGDPGDLPHPHEHALDLGIQRLRLARGRDLVALPLEQAKSATAFKLRDQLADRWLGDAQPLSSACDATGGDHGLESLNLPDVHQNPIRVAYVMQPIIY